MGDWEELCTMLESGAPAYSTAGGRAESHGDKWKGRVKTSWVSYYTLSFANFRHYWSTYDTWSKQTNLDLSTLLSSLLFFFVLLLRTGRLGGVTLKHWETGRLGGVGECPLSHSSFFLLA